jgi:ubiquinone/menaquinone biosynthesis C-methylase UbiE
MPAPLDPNATVDPTVDSTVDPTVDSTIDASSDDAEPAMDNRAYYDDFADGYERGRGHGYHRMLDDLEVALVRRYARGRDALEVGCGTGLILARVRQFAARAAGIDLSGGMLGRARARGLDVAQAEATALPYPDASFDVVYSFKVLAHIADIRTAMAEIARVTRPSGYVLAEFYNPRSLRYLVKALKPPTQISASTDDEAVYTRYDTPDAIRSYLPASLQYRTMRGVRILTPVSHVHQIRGIGSLLRAAETALADVPGIRALGGFLIAVAQKRGG